MFTEKEPSNPLSISRTMWHVSLLGALYCVNHWYEAIIPMNHFVVNIQILRNLIFASWVRQNILFEWKNIKWKKRC